MRGFNPTFAFFAECFCATGPLAEGRAEHPPKTTATANWPRRSAHRPHPRPSKPAAPLWLNPPRTPAPDRPRPPSFGAMFISGQKAAHVAYGVLRRRQAQEAAARAAAKAGQKELAL